jgi:hypothetical protein
MHSRPSVFRLLLVALIAQAVVWAQAPQQPVERERKATESASTTVYATRTGEKYHRETCRYLSKSKIPMELKEVAARYGPCAVCRAPVLPSPAAVTSSAPTAKPAAASPPARVTRCQATTKKGIQCSRNAQPGRSFCWQH